MIEPAVYLRVADKPLVAQRLQRARADSQLPADFLAREPSFQPDIMDCIKIRRLCIQNTKQNM